MADRKKKRIIILAILCCAAVILTALILRRGGREDNSIFQAAEESKTMHTVQKNEKCAMENSRFLLTLDEQTMGITITDKNSGQKYFSVKDYTDGNKLWNGFCSSGISLEFYSGNSSASTTVSVAGEEVTKTVQYFSDGFDADLKFESYGFCMQLQVRLAEDGVTVYVPRESIQEGDAYFLGAVWLYPMMGATLPGEKEGYMVIPEGSGAIIDLKDHQKKFKNAYSKMIYGGNAGVEAAAQNYYNKPVVTEPEEIRMPVFGMVYEEEKSGFLGIVTDGEYHADLVAYPNGVTTPYNWVTAKFRIRDIYTKQTARAAGVPAYESEGDFRNLGIKYLFAAGEYASYTGLANAYQNYLVQNGVLTKQEDSFCIKLDFFGADSEKWLLFQSVVPMTTIEQMENILEDLTKEGITDLLPVYTGYQKGGATGNYGSTKVGIERKLGSEKKLLDFAEKLQEKGIFLTLQQELLLANGSKLYDTTREVVKGINQVIVEKPTFQKLFRSMYYQTPARSLEILKKLNKQYKDTSICAVGFSGLPEELYSYYFKGTIYSRRDCAVQYHKILENAEFEKIGMTNPNAYLWDLTKQYYDIPMATSGYNYIAKEVPFLQTVLRGYIPYWAPYINFQSNEKVFFLKLLEYGAYPSFLVTNQSPVKLRNTNSSYIYTSEYSVLKDKILAYEKELSEVFEQLEGSGIQEHRTLRENVVMTTYKNGVTIYINYSENEFLYEDIVVRPLSYLLVK